MKTRPATIADIPRIIEMGEPFWQQTIYAKTVAYDPDSMDHFARVMINHGILIVAEKEGAIIGAVGAVIGPCYANMDYKIASELYWYVEPGDRSNGAGKALLLALEEAAVRSNVQFIAMMVLLGAGSPERAEAIYLANSYQQAEKTFVKVLQWPQDGVPSVTKN